MASRLENDAHCGLWKRRGLLGTGNARLKNRLVMVRNECVADHLLRRAFEFTSLQSDYAKIQFSVMVGAYTDDVCFDVGTIVRFAKWHDVVGFHIK